MIMPWKSMALWCQLTIDNFVPKKTKTLMFCKAAVTQYNSTLFIPNRSHTYFTE